MLERLLRNHRSTTSIGGDTVSSQRRGVPNLRRSVYGEEFAELLLLLMKLELCDVDCGAFKNFRQYYS